MITFDDHDNEETKSRLLWCSVIQNAIDDAKSNAKSVTVQNEARKARIWLTVPSRDFDEVCFLAGLDPIAVRERAQRMFPAVD